MGASGKPPTTSTERFDSVAIDVWIVNRRGFGTDLKSVGTRKGLGIETSAIRSNKTRPRWYGLECIFETENAFF